jgi:hypothetical protein
MNEMRHRTHGRAAAAGLGRTTRMASMVLLTAVLGVTGFLAASAFAGGAGSQANATLSLRGAVDRRRLRRLPPVREARGLTDPA